MILGFDLLDFLVFPYMATGGPVNSSKTNLADPVTISCIGKPLLRTLIVQLVYIFYDYWHKIHI